MPKLWSETMEAHRRAVRGATLETTARLVTEHGLSSVTMSQIAKETGIGRATLYKYFPDVESILLAWHEQHIAAHLGQLAAVRDEADTPAERLDAVLRTYARITHHRRQEGEIAAFVHRDAHVVTAQQHLRELFRAVIADAARAGEVRDDVAPDEPADYCLHALGAAGGLPTEAAVRRLVSVTLAGLRPTA